ncbi:fungal-specific transcription factor domain-containing protein [Neohortaea acidophila]|uniref:Fungal-specific transcription factor domain-containing protein n=1 Tax=Neohortaea acidophila TaxID=245834 RepID=A0A6A6Q4D9_9PEZI|nr:fungal-specific transcription factor domain-containing protein [Neohortaea acidophila]KAF2486513.1 fungal-specific transcription factor domain-containing protein [Neohortaea acidophila]
MSPSSTKSPAHLQKRRRVTRACDECRRKKIKCDGKQPCTHCTVYSYECTYDQPSNRRRNPAPQYVENLEHRVHRAETLLHILIPNLDLNDPGIDVAVQQGYIPGAPGKGNPTQAQEQDQHAPSLPLPQSMPPLNRGLSNRSDKIESMVRAVASIEMDESGNWDYHGHSSGLTFMRRMREQMGDLMGPVVATTPFIKTRHMSQVLDSPKSSAESPINADSGPANFDLPPKAVAREICRFAIEDAAALLRAIHGPTFWLAFERLYTVPVEHYTNEDQKFLPLFHTAMALGHLFNKDESSGINSEGYENAIQQGFVHFKTARMLLDIADCRDLMSIQAVMMMVLFLQSSAKLSQCYAYVGVALRSALRMGLHRNYKGNFDPLEIETRKRVFWAVRKMDIYVGAMLGLPQTLSDEDIDQEFPTEVDDEYVTRDGIRPMPEGQVSLMAAFNAHTRLVQLLSKIVRCVYPIKVQDKGVGTADQSYSVPFSVIKEIESEMEQWKNDLPPVLNPSPAPDRYTRVQHLLRLTYAHAQVMLYRPFLHYVARPPPVDQRAYACAASYVGVSRNIIHIQTQMKLNGLLNGAFWFVMYTSFFAILSLVYFAAANPDDPTTAAIIKDALEGKEVLAALAKRSLAADRCSATLEGVFRRLPEWMQKGQQNPSMVGNKKRQHGSGKASPHAQNSAASRSLPDVTISMQSEGPGLHRRAVTYPRHLSGPGGNANMTPTTHDSWSPSAASSLPQTPTSADFPPSAGAYINNYNPLNLTSTPTSTGLPPQQQYPPFAGAPPNNYGPNNPAIADMSTMLFPQADEPFVYPCQPLTTFDAHQQQQMTAAKHDNGGGAYLNGNDGLYDNPLSSTLPGLEDNIEAQFFALPPYLSSAAAPPQGTFGREADMAAHAQPHPQQQHQGVMGGQQQQAMATNGWGQQQLPQHAQHAHHHPQQQQQHMSSAPGLGGVGGVAGDISLQELFGGPEWNSMLLNGFQT